MNLKLKAPNLTKKRLIVSYKKRSVVSFKKILKNTFLCDIIPMFK